jgi:cytochrome c biogenesis protein CcdA
MTTLGLAFLAGILSTLSPCVLPLLPLVLGAAASEHRYGPLALAGGLAISFVTIGLFVATIGFSIGLDGGVFRSAASVLMIAIGLVLIIPSFQARLALAGGPVADWAERRFAGVSRVGPSGPIWRGPAARGRLESLRRPDARRSFLARGRRQEPSRSRHHHADVRHRRCDSARRVGRAVA